jgi:menaquinone-dependent protoporphyrinogen oxidase
MKTLIVYRTTHGCTAKIAHEIGTLMGGEIDYCDLKTGMPENLQSYKRIIVGGSVHAGQIQSKVKAFCQKNLATLLEKELGLFICCMYEGEVAKKQMEDAFPEDLRYHAKSLLIAGGVLNFEKLNFLERFAVKKAARINESVDNIDKASIDRFARKMDRSFIPMMLFI